MNTENFKAGNVLGVVKRINPARASFDKALYMVGLAKIYPFVRVDVSDASPNEAGGVTVNAVDLTLLAGMSIYGQIDTFASLAVRVAELHNAGFDWPKPNAAPEALDAAFQHYLDNPDVWDEIKAAIARLDFPNGKGGAPEHLLTEAEKTDPKS